MGVGSKSLCSGSKSKLTHANELLICWERQPQLMVAFSPLLCYVKVGKGKKTMSNLWHTSTELCHSHLFTPEISLRRKKIRHMEVRRKHSEPAAKAEQKQFTAWKDVAKAFIHSQRHLQRQIKKEQQESVVGEKQLYCISNSSRGAGIFSNVWRAVAGCS